MLRKMGCGSIKSISSTKPDTLIELVSTSIGSINLMDISEDRSLILIAGEAGIGLCLSTFSTPIEILGKLIGHQGAITCSAIDSLYIFTGSVDRTIRKWSIETMDCLFIFTGHYSKINRVIIRGSLMFSSSYDKLAKAWYSDVVLTPIEDYDVDDYGDDEQLTKVDVEVKSINQLSQDDLMKLSPCLQTFKGHTKSVYPIEFLPTDLNFLLTGKIMESDLVVTGSVDCTIRIWSLKFGECLKLLTDHTAPIFQIVADPLNGKQFLSGSGDGKIICWDAVTGEKVREMKDHTGPVITLSTSKRMLFSGSNDKTARAWVIEFGECTRIFHGNSAPVNLIQYYNGMVFVGLADGVANIFDSKSGTLNKCFTGHEETLTGLQVADSRMFTADLSGRLCVWDISGVKEETVFGDKIEEEESDEEDCEAVQRAIQVVDKYIRH